MQGPTNSEGQASAAPSPVPGLMDPAVVKQLVQRFQRVFPAELPAGLPPDRGVAHPIPIIPGSSPPARPMYRLSPREITAEVADAGAA